MKDYNEACHRDYQIRDKHYLEQEQNIIKLRKDLKRKIRRLYIGGFLTFALLLLLYIYIQTKQ